jgi:hypothetical protein
MDDPCEVPLGGRFHVSKTRRVGDHKREVLVVRRKMEAAGCVGVFSRTVDGGVFDVAILDGDLRTGQAECNLGPYRGNVRWSENSRGDVLSSGQLENSLRYRWKKMRAWGTGLPLASSTRMRTVPPGFL